MCGVAESTVRSLITVPRANQPPKALKDFTGEVFHLALTSEQQAKIVTNEAAAEIIFYYAFESSAANETAKFIAKKFAHMGMHNWSQPLNRGFLRR